MTMLGTHARERKRGGPPRPASALSTPKRRWSRPCTARRNLLGGRKLNLTKQHSMRARSWNLAAAIGRTHAAPAGTPPDSRPREYCHDGRFRGRRRGACPRSIPSARISRPPASSALPHPNRGGRGDSRQKCCGKDRCIASIRSIYCVNWSASEFKRYNQSQRSPWRAAPKT